MLLHCLIFLLREIIELTEKPAERLFGIKIAHFDSTLRRFFIKLKRLAELLCVKRTDINYIGAAQGLLVTYTFYAGYIDYDKAIELNPDFADAYFNRGLTHIFLGNNKLGISDLSKAGELGIVSAYNVIKRFTDQSE